MMRTLCLVIAGAAAAHLAACKKQIDRGELEERIKKSLAGVDKVLKVECPAKVEAGAHCTAEAEGGVVYKVTLTPRDDGVSWQVTSFVVDRSLAAAMVVESAKSKGMTLTADCGAGTVELPGSFECTVRDQAGESRKVRATVDKDRNLALQQL